MPWKVIAKKSGSQEKRLLRRFVSGKICGEEKKLVAKYVGCCVVRLLKMLTSAKTEAEPETCGQ